MQGPLRTSAFGDAHGSRNDAYSQAGKGAHGAVQPWHACVRQEREDTAPSQPESTSQNVLKSLN